MTTLPGDWPTCGKWPFERRYLARQVRDRMVRRRHRGDNLAIYWCREHRAWHIGSSLKRRRGPRWGGKQGRVA